MEPPPKLFVLAATCARFRAWRLGAVLPTYAAIHLEDPLPLPYEAVAYVVDLGADFDQLGQRSAVKAVDRLDLSGRAHWCTPDDVAALAGWWRAYEAGSLFDPLISIQAARARLGV